MRRIGLLLLLAMAGCTSGPTTAQKETQTITEALRASDQQANECADAIERSPEYRMLSDRFVLGAPTPAILANNRKPTEADIPPLQAVHKQLTACRTQGLVSLNTAHSDLVAVMAKTFTEADIDFGRLVKREISWGEYGRLTVERRARKTARWQAAAQTISGDLQNQHVSETLERQRAARALAAWADAQRAAMPTYTQCVYVVGGLSCTSF